MIDENLNKWIKTGTIACCLFLILEIITDIWLGSHFPGYNWNEQSFSYLGQDGSPVQHIVIVWGIVFSFLLSLFALAFYQVYMDHKGVIGATFLLMLYALGEGMGSGFFPINPPGTPATMNSQLHDLLSGTGDVAMFLFPFMLMLVYSKKDHPNFRQYLWVVIGTGTLMASLFLAAKFYEPDNFILHYKGVWQRFYMLNYHILLLAISLKMIIGKFEFTLINSDKYG